MTATATATNVLNKTWFQNLKELTELIGNTERYGKEALDNYMRSLVPRIVSHAEVMGDPTVRALHGQLDIVRGQIPGLSDKIPPRVDVWGRPLRQGVTGSKGVVNLALGPDLLSPIFMSEHDPNIIDKEIIRLAETGYNVRFARNDSKMLRINSVLLPKIKAVRDKRTVVNEIALTSEQAHFRNELLGQRAFINIKGWMKSDKGKAYLQRSRERNDHEAHREIKQEMMSLYSQARNAADKELWTHPAHTVDLYRRLNAKVQEVNANLGIMTQEGKSR